MRVALSALALLVTLPVIGSSQANATWRGDAYYGRDYAYYGYAPRYRYYGSRHHRGMRYYRSNERAEHYRTGSRRWWDAMDRDDRGGNRR